MTEEKQVTFLIPQAGESAGYIRVSSGLGQNPDGVVYKNEVEFRILIWFHYSRKILALELLR